MKAETKVHPTGPSHVARATEVLDAAMARHPGRIALASSFGGPTGMVLIDLVARRRDPPPVYFLDTGLLFEETYALVERTRARYGIEIVAVRSRLDVAAQAAEFGDELWARDPDACCDLRKVRPQRQFLSGYDAWITGLRRSQSAGRAQVPLVSTDEMNGGIEKIAPLADWTDAEIWSYVLTHDVPYNPLNDRGYPSVGCTHCTRAVRPGEDARAGRWSGFEKTECGLHVPKHAGEGI